MANFIALVYATLKNEGVDTTGMSTDEAVAKFKELQKNSGGSGTPAENRKMQDSGVKTEEVKEPTKTKYSQEETENYKPSEFKKMVSEYEVKSDVEKNTIDKYLNDLEHEPKVSKDMGEIAEMFGSELLGYDFRVKSAKSFLRKMQKEPNAEIKDNVRYTFKMEENPVKLYSDVVSELQKRGYEEIITKNYWMVDKPPYRGINSNFRTPDGNIIEVQYHTPESIDVKEKKSHQLYEMQRQYDEGTPEYEKYEKQIQEVWDNVKRPEGIEKIQHKGWGK